MMLDMRKRSNCKRTGSVCGQLVEMDGQMATWKRGRSPGTGEGAGSSTITFPPSFQQGCSPSQPHCQMQTAALLQWEGEELQGDLEITVIFNAYEFSVKTTLFK